jgi:hypothetical protein
MKKIKSMCNWCWKTKTWKKLDVTDNNKVTEYSADHIIATALAPVNYPTPQDGEKSGDF